MTSFIHCLHTHTIFQERSDRPLSFICYKPSLPAEISAKIQQKNVNHQLGYLYYTVYQINTYFTLYSLQYWMNIHMYYVLYYYFGGMDSQRCILLDHICLIWSQVRVQTMPGWSTTLREGFPRILKEEGVGGWGGNLFCFNLFLSIGWCSLSDL